jgi:chitinase
MIGQNDQAGEIFTIGNAQSVVSFANSNGVGRLAFWSVGRDQPCPGGAGGGASPNCSSISQTSLQFTGIFNGSTVGNPPPTTGPPSPTVSPTGGTGGPCSAPAWNATTAYVGGSTVSYNGHTYTSKWWTQGEQPDTHSGQYDVWTDNGPCSGGTSSPSPSPTRTTSPSPSPTRTTSPSPSPTSTGAYPAWVANHAYAIGDRVSYAGHNYQCIQAHTSLVGWEPPNTPALWQLLN